METHQHGSLLHRIAIHSTIAIVMPLTLIGCGRQATDSDSGRPGVVKDVAGVTPTDPHIALKLPAASAAMPDNVKTLVQQLGDNDPEQRVVAARGLGMLGPKAVTAVPQLSVTLNDADLYVRVASAESLGMIDDPMAVDPLIVIVKNFDEDWMVRARAIESLGLLGAESAIDPIIACRVDMSAHVRLAVVSALSLLGGDQARAVIEEMAVSDPNEGVTLAAQEAMNSL